MSEQKSRISRVVSFVLLHISYLTIKADLKHPSHSWICLGSVYILFNAGKSYLIIPRAEGDWDICLLRGNSSFIIQGGFPQDFSDGSRSRGGQCLWGISESTISWTRYPLPSSKFRDEVSSIYSPGLFHLQPFKWSLKYLVFFYC